MCSMLTPEIIAEAEAEALEHLVEIVEERDEDRLVELEPEFIFDD